MSIYYEETGSKDKPSIVFLHGGGISGWMWQKQVEYFRDYHCIVPDLPEHRNSINEGPLSLSDCAVRIAELIEKKANNGRAHIVGHSLGGKIVVELLSRRPDLVDHAIVASALFRSIPLFKLIHRPSVYKLTAAMMKNESMLAFTVKQFKAPDKYYADNLIEDFRKLTADSLYRIYDQLYQYQKLPLGLADIKVPTLIVAGEKELGAMKQSVIDIVKELPNSKGILVKKADHTYPWAMYESFNNIIKSWISDRKMEDSGLIEINGDKFRMEQK
ncbi:MAG TPA: alpha/beta hydrolase [Bacillota bacterium]|nr:alpha/beta hydrolase [Bacillota bacterium]